MKTPLSNRMVCIFIVTIITTKKEDTKERDYKRQKISGSALSLFILIFVPASIFDKNCLRKIETKDKKFVLYVIYNLDPKNWLVVYS